MLLDKPSRVLKRLFPLIAVVLFLLITFASVLKLTHLPIPALDYHVYTDQPTAPTGHWFPLWLISMFLVYLTAIPGIMCLVVAFFCSAGRAGRGTSEAIPCS